MVPEIGSHNHWIDGDILLAGFYQGGIRILDISGELLGDLYKQGREIGFFKSSHKEGRISNAIESIIKTLFREKRPQRR